MKRPASPDRPGEELTVASFSRSKDVAPNVDPAVCAGKQLGCVVDQPSQRYSNVDSSNELQERVAKDEGFIGAAQNGTTSNLLQQEFSTMTISEADLNPQGRCIFLTLEEMVVLLRLVLLQTGTMGFLTKTKIDWFPIAQALKKDPLDCEYILWNFEPKHYRNCLQLIVMEVHPKYKRRPERLQHQKDVKVFVGSVVTQLKKLLSFLENSAGGPPEVTVPSASTSEKHLKEGIQQQSAPVEPPTTAIPTTAAATDGARSSGDGLLEPGPMAGAPLPSGGNPGQVEVLGGISAYPSSCTGELSHQRRQPTASLLLQQQSLLLQQQQQQQHYSATPERPFMLNPGTSSVSSMVPLGRYFRAPHLLPGLGTSLDSSVGVAGTTDGVVNFLHSEPGSNTSIGGNNLGSRSNVGGSTTPFTSDLNRCLMSLWNHSGSVGTGGSHLMPSPFHQSSSPFLLMQGGGPSAALSTSQHQQFMAAAAAAAAQQQQHHHQQQQQQHQFWSAAAAAVAASGGGMPAQTASHHHHSPHGAVFSSAGPRPRVFYSPMESASLAALGAVPIDYYEQQDQRQQFLQRQSVAAMTPAPTAVSASNSSPASTQQQQQQHNTSTTGGAVYTPNAASAATTAWAGTYSPVPRGGPGPVSNPYQSAVVAAAAAFGASPGVMVPAAPQQHAHHQHLLQGYGTTAPLQGAAVVAHQAKQRPCLMGSGMIGAPPFGLGRAPPVGSAVAAGSTSTGLPGSQGLLMSAVQPPAQTSASPQMFCSSPNGSLPPPSQSSLYFHSFGVPPRC